MLMLGLTVMSSMHNNDSENVANETCWCQVLEVYLYFIINFTEFVVLNRAHSSASEHLIKGVNFFTCKQFVIKLVIALARSF